MKFFPVEPEIDRQIELLMRQIRKLKDGETAELIEKSGARYRVNYGVSIVYLRQMAADMPKSAGLAHRLWARQIRETMILATMVVAFEDLGNDGVREWGEMLNTIELSEQLGRNLLSGLDVPQELLVDWLKSGHFYRQYAALMAIGWRLRMHQVAGFPGIHDLLTYLKQLACEPRYLRAITFALKMAGRQTALQQKILENAREWKASENPYVSEIGMDVVFEVETFL